MDESSRNHMNGNGNGQIMQKNEKEEVKSNNTESKPLKIGMLTHHEIENFITDEDKIESNCQECSWSNCDATSFNVRRGPNYQSGQKSPSKKALYKMFALDAYKLPRKVNKMFKYMDIDTHINKYRTSPYDKDKNPLPPLFILNLMVPNYAPELMGNKSDGEGYSLIFYAHLTSHTQQLIKQGKMLPAIDLMKDFIHSDLVNSELRNRFKCIVRLMNPSHTNFGFLANKLVKRYNGKPFLARTSSTFYHEPGRYFAADIDVHVFGYPARQGLSYVKDTIQTAIYDIGFVIEGHTNEQLPEQILSCCRISKMGVDLCKTFPIELLRMYTEQKEKKTKQNDVQQQTPSKPLKKSQSNIVLIGTNNCKNGDVSLSKSQSTDSLNGDKKDQNDSGSGWFSGYF